MWQQLGQGIVTHAAYNLIKRLRISVLVNSALVETYHVGVLMRSLHNFLPRFVDLAIVKYSKIKHNYRVYFYKNLNQ